MKNKKTKNKKIETEKNSETNRENIKIIKKKQEKKN